MTNKEAINMLSMIKVDKTGEFEPLHTWYGGIDKDMQEAVEMAISALDDHEPCKDAISRQAVLEMAYDVSEIDGEHFTEPCMVVDVEDIQKLPSVNPTKTGHWIEHEIKDTCRWLTCSVCGYEWVNKKENFCPNCGCRMIEPQERSE